MQLETLIALDLPPLLAAIFSSVACALLGNYLVLRRLSLMGDAISHSVLPGIVIAFLLTSSRASVPVFIGAAVAGIASAVLIEIVRRYGRVETGASMGVIFSIFFALGVVLIEQAAARSVDLDADCLLHGQLESIFWSPPHKLSEFLSFSTLNLLPDEVITSFLTMLLIIAFIVLLYKELQIATFDPELSTSLGISSSLIYNLLMFLVACAVVASFRVVGSILVIAMIICPAAAARLLTDRLSTQLKLSAALAVIPCILGYILGAFGPHWLGFENSVSASGMITIVLGAQLLLAILFAPIHGVVAKLVRQRRLAMQVRGEDILSFLYRVEESAASSEQLKVRASVIEPIFGANRLTRAALTTLRKNDLVSFGDGDMFLSESGRNLARELVRSHRLWENYLVTRLGLKPDHVHETAEKLEHVTDTGLQEKVAEIQGSPKQDPHGRAIP